MAKIYLHIPKTGGTALWDLEGATKAEMSMCSPTCQQAVKSGALAEFETRAMPIHMRYKDLKIEVRSTNTIFAVLRNPWNRAASRFCYGKVNALVGVPKTFEKFLDERIEYAEVDMSWQAVSRGWYGQLEYITDEQDIVCCDLIRFEHLDSELKKYLNITTVPYERPNTKDIAAMYTSRTIQLVADWYKDEIDYFGFDFDTSAQKNTWFTGKSS